MTTYYDGQGAILTVGGAVLFALALIASWNLFKRLVTW